MEPLPSMTIVTASYNRGSLIEGAVESVLNQHYPGMLEHIIVDGNSTDDTLVRLSRYPHLRIISEPDEGVYDAWNMGVRLATGDVIGILNSDDQFGSGVLRPSGRYSPSAGVSTWSLAERWCSRICRQAAVTC
jgi:glycosyltransferase involved in cell wall biosynthesis